MSRSPTRSAEIESKVKDFDRTITRIEKKIGFTRQSAPSTRLIIGVMTPVLILAILFFAQPGFTTKQEGDSKVRDMTKVAQWTVIFTGVAYVVVYGCAVGFRKYNKTAKN